MHPAFNAEHQVERKTQLFKCFGVNQWKNRTQVFILHARSRRTLGKSWTLLKI